MHVLLCVACLLDKCACLSVRLYFAREENTYNVIIINPSKLTCFFLSDKNDKDVHAPSWTDDM